LPFSSEKLQKKSFSSFLFIFFRHSIDIFSDKRVEGK